MATSLIHYKKIKDNYCISYYGDDDDILKSLSEARSIIENKLPGIKIFIACLKEKTHLVEGSISNTELDSSQFAHYRELDCNVEELLREIEVPA